MKNVIISNERLIELLEEGYYPVNIDKGTTGIFVNIEEEITYLVISDEVTIQIKNEESIRSNTNNNKDVEEFKEWMEGYWNTYSYREFIESIREFRENTEYYEENVEFIIDCLEKDDWEKLNLFIDLAMNDNLSLPISRIIED